ncbi:MAG: cofactor-independent phosphoglycerate mutase [Chitinispirillales bacterium]|jgi:2,3-bisphosphoglycerate-independent phosphoglycerate mutase|nr:cofactor-independent phosphoglycerate mutase [Chitinispirillales bacterium]
MNMKQKYLILVGDGMADFPIPSLGGRTPLESAATPNMDRIAASGRIGLLSTIPDGFLPGSDIGNMSLLGYDPRRYFSGRAPIEAASMGIALGPDDVAFRCNLVTIADGVMKDYSAGHISTEAAHAVINALQKSLGIDGELKFHPGVSYRHLLTVKKIGAKLECTPPHDITGQKVDTYLPKGGAAGDRDYVLSIMNRAKAVIAELQQSALSEAETRHAATDIWLWGQGPAVTLPTLKERYGITGSVISAVDLVRGLGKLAGLTVRIVDGATGYLGTNYAGKTAAAVAAFESDEDFVYLHIEAPDETSHEGVLEKKIQAIEEFDRYAVGEMLEYQSKNPNLRIAVSPDHITALSTKTHDASPVPFCMCGEGIKVDSARRYCEAEAQGQSINTIEGPEFFERLVGGD